MKLEVVMRQLFVYDSFFSASPSQQFVWCVRWRCLHAEEKPRNAENVTNQKPAAVVLFFSLSRCILLKGAQELGLGLVTWVSLGLVEVKYGDIVLYLLRLHRENEVYARFVSGARRIQRAFYHLHF